MRQKQNAKKIEESAQKKNSLVVKTQFQSSFDLRWAQIKITGKNISCRSNHAATVFNSKLYIHGGYDVQKGVLADFQCIDLASDSQYKWIPLKQLCEGIPVRLKNHSAITHNNFMVLFGGQEHSNKNSNLVYLYDFILQKWQKIKPNIAIPEVDSHSVVVYDGIMYVIGGYISSQANFMRNIYGYDLEKKQWQLVYQHDPMAKQPEGRSDFDCVVLNKQIWLFGGTNGTHTLNDMWKFDLIRKKWVSLEQKNIPEARRGHSMLAYEGYLFMFGGIQDITKEKNDIYIFQPNNTTWNKIHTTTNSIYDCSPTLKRNKKDHTGNHSPQKFTLTKISPEKGVDKGPDAMKKILNQNKQKKFMERKKQLLKQFSEKPSDFNKNRSYSPTTESMLKTLETIGNQDNFRRQLKQEIIYDESHRLIIGKKPCARDGQSVNICNKNMYIFGGDRHLMTFNDLYIFDLEKGLKSLELYRNN